MRNILFYIYLCLSISTVVISDLKDEKYVKFEVFGSSNQLVELSMLNTNNDFIYGYLNKGNKLSFTNTNNTIAEKDILFTVNNNFEINAHKELNIVKKIKFQNITFFDVKHINFNAGKMKYLNKTEHINTLILSDNSVITDIKKYLDENGFYDTYNYFKALDFNAIDIDPRMLSIYNTLKDNIKANICEYDNKFITRFNNTYLDILRENEHRIKKFESINDSYDDNTLISNIYNNIVINQDNIELYIGYFNKAYDGIYLQIISNYSSNKDLAEKLYALIQSIKTNNISVLKNIHSKYLTLFKNQIYFLITSEINKIDNLKKSNNLRYDSFIKQIEFFISILEKEKDYEKYESLFNSIINKKITFKARPDPFINLLKNLVKKFLVNFNFDFNTLMSENRYKIVEFLNKYNKKTIVSKEKYIKIIDVKNILNVSYDLLNKSIHYKYFINMENEVYKEYVNYINDNTDVLSNNVLSFVKLFNTNKINIDKFMIDKKKILTTNYKKFFDDLKAEFGNNIESLRKMNLFKNKQNILKMLNSDAEGYLRKITFIKYFRLSKKDITKRYKKMFEYNFHYHTKLNIIYHHLRKYNYKSIFKTEKFNEHYNKLKELAIKYNTFNYKVTKINKIHKHTSYSILLNYKHTLIYDLDHKKIYKITNYDNTNFIIRAIDLEFELNNLYDYYYFIDERVTQHVDEDNQYNYNLYLKKDDSMMLNGDSNNKNYDEIVKVNNLEGKIFYKYEKRKKYNYCYNY